MFNLGRGVPIKRPMNPKCKQNFVVCLILIYFTRDFNLNGYDSIDCKTIPIAGFHNHFYIFLKTFLSISDLNEVKIIIEAWGKNCTCCLLSLDVESFRYM